MIERGLKNAIIFAIIVVSLSIAYYFIIFLPNKEQTTKNLKSQEYAIKRQEYIAKRKMDCYKIEQQERERWNNVEGSYYDELNDSCIIYYKDKNGKIFESRF